MSDSEDLYRVVFAGNITGDFSLDRTKTRFGKTFRLSADKVERIFNGKEITLKRNLSEAGAMDFAVKLAEIGCETYIEMMPTEGENFEELRKTIRRIRFRRGPRPGAIVPDRRLLPSRRAADIEMLERTGDFPGNTVSPEKNIFSGS
ncbi:MAG: hypothetical protein JJ934_11720 [Pseudomonadales bacterium]|nr:hypothetical protein [Pseudomonadales bacterium]MBO6564356.1 hypothetical protein [Pseudomonadales bacterium]MBO6595439.1 hypothetical protein [Pseudomonadales bacterium]MBO6657558.1 hypothetical protein [Pseudomonadales bacterium]MBO6701939.1 hypothetical protein [Pseudomonadales bacterium]